MLRKLVLASTLLVLAAAGCAKTTPTQDVAADKAKLQADALTWFDHFAHADSESLANLYTDDAIILPPNMPAVSGKPAIKSFLGTMATQTKAAGMTLQNGQLTGSDVSGDIGWLTGTYAVQDSTGNTVDTGGYMSIHRRTNGTWLYVRDTWNSDRPAAPAAAPATRK